MDAKELTRITESANRDKAIAEIKAKIKKEGGEIFCQDNPLKRKEQKA